MQQASAARLGRSAAQLRDAGVAVEDIACERLSVVSCVSCVAIVQLSCQVA
jgi:hypothetical protein